MTAVPAVKNFHQNALMHRIYTYRVCISTKWIASDWQLISQVCSFTVPISILDLNVGICAVICQPLKVKARKFQFRKQKSMQLNQNVTCVLFRFPGIERYQVWTNHSGFPCSDLNFKLFTVLKLLKLPALFNQKYYMEI